MKQLTKKRITAPVFSVMPVLMYLVLAVFISIPVAIVAGINGMTEEDLANNVFMQFIDQICMLIGGVLCCIILKMRNGTSIKEVIRVKNFDIAVPLMLLLGAWSAGELCDHFGGLLLSRFMTVEPNRDVAAGIAGVISTVIAAPIVEEIIFRFLGSEFPRGAYSMPIICIASGLFFSSMHLYNIQGFLNVLIGGLTASYVYCKTRNILYTMLEHAVHNALCYLPIDKWFYYEKNGFVLSEWPWLVINGVILAAVLVYYFKVFRKKYTENYFEVNRETGLPASATVKAPVPFPENYERIDQNGMQGM